MSLSDRPLLETVAGAAVWCDAPRPSRVTTQIQFLEVRMFLLWIACSEPAPVADPTPAPPAQNAEENTRIRGLFKPLPTDVPSEKNPITADKVALGRMLYYDTRLSKSQDVSCNTCHLLDKYGVDSLTTSSGVGGQKGGRNAPTVYNAALHLAQFWDGRAEDVEAQAKGPILNPIEMGMTDDKQVLSVIVTVPGYQDLFAKAFPGETPAITYDNVGRAIGAFERTLVTPSPFDKWLAGDDSALTAEQRAGLQAFADTGCVACHNGVGIGGGSYQKLGMVKPYDTPDRGRAEVTKNDADAFFFKVPSLRNIAKTGPYFHDGKVTSLDEAVRLMAFHQLGKELTPDVIKQIVGFLDTTTGEIPMDKIAKPTLPENGPTTPGPT
jgi:cytochrome c peroxidase